MNKLALTIVLIFASVFLICSGTKVGQVVDAQFEGLPYDPPIVTVLSPSQNVTYATPNVALNVTVQINGFIYHNVETIKWLNYSLDGHTAIPMTLIVPSNLSPGYYVYGNDMLTGLSEGTHNLTIYGETTISGLTGNFNATVSFKVDTTLSRSDSFPTTIVAAVTLVVVLAVAAGLLVYHKKRRPKSGGKT